MEKPSEAAAATGEGMTDAVPFVSQPSPAGPSAQDSPKTVGGGGIGGAAGAVMAPGIADDVKERARYQEVRTKALEDKKVRTLQERADNATDDAAQKKASEAYYKALYSRMRKIDPALKDRIDRVEKATLRRLDRKKPATPAAETDETSESPEGEEEQAVAGDEGGMTKEE